jgi:hypothetical protein
MIDPILLATGKLAAAADGVIRCPSVMDLGDRLRTLEICLNEYNILIFGAPKQDMLTNVVTAEGGIHRRNESFAKIGLNEQ